MELYIKNMVCERCKSVVAGELKHIEDIEILHIGLGWITLKHPLTGSALTELRKRLRQHGLEVISDQKSKLVSRIKALIIDEVHHDRHQKADHENFSEFLKKEIGYDYSYLNELFSSLEGKTIGQYIIEHKIEKIKELMVYDELSLSEIAWRLNYSSVQYLSAQFKKYTGLSPSHFKKIGRYKRKSLDQV